MGDTVLNPEDSGTQQRKTCIQCGSTVGEKDFSCPQCGGKEFAFSDAYERKVPSKGKQFNPFSVDPHTNPMQFQKGVPINRAASTQKKSEVKDITEKEKKDKDNVDSDIVPYVSKDFLQCIDPTEVFKRKPQRNVDKHVEEVTKSCLDLAIDG